jgi:hypothetical protein
MVLVDKVPLAQPVPLALLAPMVVAPVYSESSLSSWPPLP